MRLTLLLVLIGCGSDRLIAVSEEHECSTTPTSVVVLSEPLDVEDSTIYNNHPGYEDYNLGGLPELYTGYSNAQWILWHSLLRLDTTVIPEGEITAFRLHLWRVPNEWSQVPGRVEFYAAKSNWSGGTTSTFTGPEDGAVDWFHTQHPTGTWTEPGGDVVPTEEPPSLDYQPCVDCQPAEIVVDLPVSWAVSWRDGTQNNGILIREVGQVSNSLLAVASSESLHPVVFEIAAVTP